MCCCFRLASAPAKCFSLSLHGYNPLYQGQYMVHIACTTPRPVPVDQFPCEKSIGKATPKSVIPASWGHAECRHMRVFQGFRHNINPTGVRWRHVIRNVFLPTTWGASMIRAPGNAESFENLWQIDDSGLLESHRTRKRNLRMLEGFPLNKCQLPFSCSPFFFE